VTLADEIRQRREERGITLATLAKSIGRTKTLLAGIERGVPTSNETLLRIAAVLDMSEDDVLCMAGRVPDDVVAIICSNPAICKQIREFVPGSRFYSHEEIAQISAAVAYNR
jgi:transcriptional regulator with XRE-family HTH domain